MRNHLAIIIGTVRSLWTWLWSRHHVPQNAFLVWGWKQRKITLLIKVTHFWQKRAIVSGLWVSSFRTLEHTVNPPLSEILDPPLNVRSMTSWPTRGDRDRTKAAYMGVLSRRSSHRPRLWSCCSVSIRQTATRNHVTALFSYNLSAAPAKKSSCRRRGVLTAECDPQQFKLSTTHHAIEHCGRTDVDELYIHTWVEHGLIYPCV